MNIQERIEALEEEFNKKLKALKAEAHRKQEFPQEDDFYWYMDPTGRALIGEWEGFNIAKDMLEIGNIFKTEEQVEFAAEKLRVEAELRKFSRPFECGEINQYIFLDTDSDRIDVENRYYFPTQGTIYFESAEKVQQALKSVGRERIKKYIFGVED